MNEVHIKIIFSYDAKCGEYVWTIKDAEGNVLERRCLCGSLHFLEGDKVVLDLTIEDEDRGFLGIVGAISEAYMVAERARDYPMRGDCDE